MILTFGKFKGSYIQDVPDSYLLWLVDQEWLYDTVRDEVEMELLARKVPHNAPSPKMPDNSHVAAIYKMLAKKYHPDKGGTTESMQAINDFYTELKKYY